AVIVGRVAQECASTAMVLCMHYCGAAVLEAYASEPVRRAVVSGEHLSTLAFSETGSRSHFWAPAGGAQVDGDTVILNGEKSFSTSASRATAYIWSSKPLQAEGASTLWLVPTGTSGLKVRGPFNGLGLRGNDSAPISGKDVRIPRAAMLGTDGEGFDIMMRIVLPVFNVLNAACSVGLMEAAVRKTAEHASAIRHSDTGTTLADLP